MSQNDFNIANQGFPSFRSDLNNALQALASTSSGATAPATPYANQLWYDTANDLLKIRNEANSAWVDVLPVLGVTATADELNKIAGVTATAAELNQLDTNTFTSDITIPDKIIHAGDTNTSIRFPAADTVTVETDGAERLRVTSAGNVGIGTTSPAAMLDLTTNNAGLGPLVANNRLRFTDTDPTLVAGQTTGSVEWYTSDTDNAGVHAYIGTLGSNNGAGAITFGTGVGGSAAERMRIDSAGNVGIGATSPAEQLHITGNLRVGSAVLGTPSGSAPMYTCRAWVKFNGTGTVAINGSGNVSSITDGGTGTYTVNFTTAMPDADYAAVASAGNGAASDRITSTGQATYSTTACGVRTSNDAGGLADTSIISFAVFR